MFTAKGITSQTNNALITFSIDCEFSDKVYPDRSRGGVWEQYEGFRVSHIDWKSLSIESVIVEEIFDEFGLLLNRHNCPAVRSLEGVLAVALRSDPSAIEQQLIEAYERELITQG